MLPACQPEFNPETHRTEERTDSHKSTSLCLSRHMAPVHTPEQISIRKNKMNKIKC